MCILRGSIDMHVCIQVIRHYHGHLSAINSICLHPTLDVLMTGGRDAAVRVRKNARTPIAFACAILLHTHIAVDTRERTSCLHKPHVPWPPSNPSACAFVGGMCSIYHTARVAVRTCTATQHTQPACMHTCVRVPHCSFGSTVRLCVRAVCMRSGRGCVKRECVRAWLRIIRDLLCGPGACRPKAVSLQA